MRPWPAGVPIWPSLWPQIWSTTAMDRHAHAILPQTPATVATGASCPKNQRSAAAGAAQSRTPARLGASRSNAGQKVAHKARGCRPPGLDLFPLMPPHIIEHHVHRLDARGNLPSPMVQKGHAFHLPFALGRCGIPLPGARVKTSKQMQSALAGILGLDSYRPPRLGGQGGGLACPWLQTGFLVHAAPHFSHAQRARIPGHKGVDLSGKGRIPWDLRRQPQMVAPRFALMVRQHPLDGLRRNRHPHPVVDQLPGQCCTLPLRQRTPNDIWPFTGQCDHRQRHRRGQKRAGDPDAVRHTAPRYQRPQSAAPTCGHAAHATQPVWRWQQNGGRLPAATWPAPAWPGQQGFAVAGATPRRWLVCRHPSQDGLLSYAPAWFPPR